MPETMICCQRCDSSTYHDTEKVAPKGWMRFAEGWICENHHPNIEELLNELKRITDAMERGTMSLEQSLVEYEHAVLIQERVRKYLRDADDRVEIIRADGRIEEFDHEAVLAKKQSK